MLPLCALWQPTYSALAAGYVRPQAVSGTLLLFIGQVRDHGQVLHGPEIIYRPAALFGGADVLFCTRTKSNSQTCVVGRPVNAFLRSLHCEEGF